MKISSPEAKKYKNKTGVTLVATGIYTRIFARQYFAAKNFDITPEQFVVIEILMENDGLYQRQICEIVMKDRPNMTRIINILCDLGYVQRVSDKNKRKVHKIFLTQKAKDNYPQMMEAILDIRKTIVEGIDKDELEVCLNVLNKIIENLYPKVDMHN